ncbi:hypothetical protein Ct9H90mP29_08280 [bacterium]|nr:MAG: hypothetical protein Ct9H90mP29_08280 [bacterium]
MEDAIYLAIQNAIFDIDLDDNYQFTVIGYPSRKYVWIMAREPKLSDEVYEGILSNLAEVGYDISQINKILQQWN